MSILYEDKYLICDDDAITIKEYFFPFGSKRISYSSIKKMEEFPLTLMGGKFRIWGMGLEPKWFHLDWERPNKKNAILLDTGEFIKSALTPKAHDTVLAILQEKTRG